MRKGLIVSLSIFLVIFSFSLILSQTKAAADHLVINEVYYDVAKDKGAEGTNEWVEIYNPTSFEINLKNWTISDSTTAKRKINSDINIKSKGYVIITKNPSTWPFWTLPDEAIKIELGFNIGSGLNNDGDKVILRDTSDVVIDQISYGSDKYGSDKDILELLDVAEGHSLERAPAGGIEFVDQPYPTPGIGLPAKTILSLGAVTEQSIAISWTQNQDSDFEKYLVCVLDVDCLSPFQSIVNQTITTATIDDLAPGTQYEIKVRVLNSSGGYWDSNVVTVFTKMTYSKVIIVNELFPHPSTGTDNEFIELYNSSTEAVDLSGWILKDGEGSVTTYNISDKTVINANSYLIFYKKDIHISLNDDGDFASLFWPDGTLISTTAAYKNADVDISWSRNVDGSWLFSTTATPGKANIFTSKQEEIISIPVIPVEEAKKQKKNEWVKVEGVVIASPGLFGKRVMYIQDGSGGIKIYFDKALWPDLKIGDKVIIWGKISISAGEFQIKVYETDGIVVVGYDPSSEPAEMKIAELNDFIGQLIKVSGRVVKISGSTIWINDGTGELRLYFYPATGIKGLGLDEGDWVVVVGILSKTSAGLRLLARAKSDIKIYKKSVQNKSDESNESIINQVLGVEKAQAAGIDYRNFNEPKAIESKRRINIFGIVLIFFGFFSLVSLQIFARIHKKIQN